GAYSVEMPKGRITFLDTPGHEAFTAMRARGAHITDIVVLVVAADEGIMPQTEEAIDHARAANTPIVVAMNKMDRPGANPDNVKKQLAERDLASEDWGGKTVVVGVSAMTGEGIDELLEMILLEAELLELKANPHKRASGIVVEAHLSQGKGTVTTLIVQSGTLSEGDYLIAGPHWGKVKALFDDHGRTIKEAGPSMPVEILGLSEVPDAGEMFYVVPDERQAKEISYTRQEKIKNKKMQASSAISLDDLYAQIQDGAIKELNVVLKADVQGSLEALKDSLEKIPSDKVKVKFIHVGVGEINTSDVLLAVASKAIIIAFHVGINPKAREALEKDPVEVREYRIIYDAVNDIRNALEGMLEAKTKKNFFAKIEVRQVFKLTKGIVAGCYVTKGKVPRKAHVDLVREDEIIYSGIIASLKRFKEDVKEVTEGMECGIQLENFTEYQAGDMLEVYTIEKITQRL
ncbi:MAG: translation initiation factor IF-2, partial [Candidatus Omnitrophica bacterium]|nr:translation initiation factor IF-2 [Candidatus Omnitrophota bacterium]